MGSISSFGRGHARAQWPESESAELLRLAIEVAGIGIFENDLRQKRTRFSRELCAIFGLPVGTEMPYEEAWRLVDERDRPAFEAAANGDASSAEKGKWSGVCRVLRADGAVRWVMAHGRRIYRRTAKDVQPLRSMGVVLDVTNLKESQEALQESERRLRLALDAAQMGTFEAEIGATELAVDSQEARLLGLPKERRIVAADELRARVPLEDLRESDAKKERLQLHNEAYLHEFRLRMPDGSERWLSDHAAIRANRIFGVTCDITQRKRGEAALRESGTRLRIAASGAALGIFEWDPTTDQAIWENDRMYEIFGHAREDGTPSQQQFVDRFLHPDDAAVYWAALNEALRTASNFHAVCRIRQNGGLQRWIEIHGKFRRAASDEPLRLVGVIADITARKALEQETKELCERLLTLQEEERQCIAQELHDSTTQHLVAANLNLMRLRSKFGQRGDDLELVDAIERSINEAGKEVRTFSYLMHPPALQALGFVAAIRQYIDGYADRSQLDCNFRSNPKVDKLPFRVQRPLFRIVQEALGNVNRHAAASHVSVDLRLIANRLHLMIADDGCGIGSDAQGSQAALYRPGVGISGIRARVRQLDGDLKIRTGPHGTSIHVVVPVVDKR